VADSCPGAGPVAVSLSPMLFAHEGGWDEALFVAVPVAIFFLLLVLANRRANQLRADADQPEEADPHDR